MNEELKLLADTARPFAARHGGASVLRARRAGASDEASLWQACVEQGFHGVALPEVSGGAGLGCAGLATLLEAGGAALLDLPILSGVHLAAVVYEALEDDSIASEKLAALALGEGPCLVAWQSEQAHPDPYAPSVTATRQGEGALLHGVASCVLGGAEATRALVVAQGDEGLGIFEVQLEQPQIRVETQHLLDHRHCVQIHFDAAQPSEFLGGEPWARSAVDRVLDAGRLGLAAQMLGGARAVMDETLDYLKTRRQFGVPIGSFQALQHRMAAVYVRVQLAQASLRRGVEAWHLEGAAQARGAAMAKALCGEAYMLAAREGVQMHGGIGVTDEHSVGFHLKAAQVGNQLYGSPAAMRSLWASLGEY